MALTKKQDVLYWRTWSRLTAAIKKDDPELTSKQISEMRAWQHKAAKCPDSHKAWKSADLTRWLAHAAAVEDPANLDRQLAFAEQIKSEAQREEHPEWKRIYAIECHLRELGKPLVYAIGIVQNIADAQGRNAEKEPPRLVLQAPLPHDLRKWPADALQAALQALARNLSAQKRAQLPGESPF